MSRQAAKIRKRRCCSFRRFETLRNHNTGHTGQVTRLTSSTPHNSFQRSGKGASKAPWCFGQRHINDVDSTLWSDSNKLSGNHSRRDKRKKNISVCRASSGGFSTQLKWWIYWPNVSIFSCVSNFLITLLGRLLPYDSRSFLNFSVQTRYDRPASERPTSQGEQLQSKLCTINRYGHDVSIDQYLYHRRVHFDQDHQFVLNWWTRQVACSIV